MKLRVTQQNPCALIALIILSLFTSSQPTWAGPEQDELMAAMAARTPRLIQEGVDRVMANPDAMAKILPNEKREDGYSPFLLAVRTGNFKVFQYFLKNGADLNQPYIHE